jgi:hypothetical protein
MAYNQELFAKGRAAYQKVIDANYMAHREVHGLLHGVLMTEAPGRFVFTDLACCTWREAEWRLLSVATAIAVTAVLSYSR